MIVNGTKFYQIPYLDSDIVYIRLHYNKKYVYFDFTFKNRITLVSVSAVSYLLLQQPVCGNSLTVFVSQ